MLEESVITSDMFNSESMLKFTHRILHENDGRTHFADNKFKRILRESTEVKVGSKIEDNSFMHWSYTFYHTDSNIPNIHNQAVEREVFIYFHHKNCF